VFLFIVQFDIHYFLLLALVFKYQASRSMFTKVEKEVNFANKDMNSEIHVEKNCNHRLVKMAKKAIFIEFKIDKMMQTIKFYPKKTFAFYFLWRDLPQLF